LSTDRGFMITTDNGTIETDAGTTFMVDGVIADAVAGAPGMLSKTGSGTLLLTASNSYSGETLVNAGTLKAGAVNRFRPNSAVTTSSSGTLDLNGFDQTVMGLANAGLVRMGANTAPGTVLTVTGNYVGNGGTIAFNTGLGDDSSATDRMVVTGNT